jgi:hypothetical protein
MGIKFSSGPFIDHAVEASGLDDFGGHTFEEGLDALIHSLNHDLDLAEIPAGYFRRLISQRLINRLEVTQLIKNHPEILEEKIERLIGIQQGGSKKDADLAA